MFFNSIKKENMSRKDINRLSKGTSNIYLKVAIEKNWHSKHRFSKLKKFITRISQRYWILRLLVAT